MGFKRSSMKCVAIAAATVATSFAISPSASHADQAGSYTSNYTGANPEVFYPRQVNDGPNEAVPASVPANGVITSISGRLGTDTQPHGMWWTAYLCADAADTQCANVSPTGVWQYDAGWNYSTTAFAGWPATTKFHFAFVLQDGKTGNIIPALNPPLYVRTQNLTVNYTYPDAATPTPTPTATTSASANGAAA